MQYFERLKALAIAICRSLMCSQTSDFLNHNGQYSVKKKIKKRRRNGGSYRTTYNSPLTSKPVSFSLVFAFRLWIPQLLFQTIFSFIWQPLTLNKFFFPFITLCCIIFSFRFFFLMILLFPIRMLSKIKYIKRIEASWEFFFSNFTCWSAQNCDWTQEMRKRYKCISIIRYAFKLRFLKPLILQ